MPTETNETEPGRADDQKPVKEAPKSRQQEDAELEKALEDTFPASDPPATSSPATSVGWEGPVPEDKK
jgi:hypothetical protein